MKYILFLYVCSFTNVQQPNCYATHVVPLEFTNYTDCILQGYKSSHNTLKELYFDKIENEKLAIKFECKEIGEKV
jgi:hypothetical protein|tara:strand:+ start:334 stop:558 length:225 start_codon:yes stop_codon:yes gene_type:complete